MSAEEAVECAEIGWFGSSTFLSKRGPEIHQVLDEWLDSLVGRVEAVTIETDYEPRTKLLLEWTDKNGFTHWPDLWPKDANRYAQEGSNSRKRSAIEKRCRVIRMANKYVQENYPDFYRPLPYKLPKGKESDGDRDSLRLHEGVEFLFLVREMPHGWNTLPGFAIAVLAGDRVQGFRDILWRHIDWVKRKSCPI